MRLRWIIQLLTYFDEMKCLFNAIFYHFSYSNPLATFYSTSYLWYCAIGWVVTMVIGTLTSLLLGKSYYNFGTTNWYQRRLTLWSQKQEQSFENVLLWIDGTLSFIFLSKETEEEKKEGVDPKLVFPLKLWLLSWLPSQRKRWDSNTGLPQSDDKEDWVQLGERKRTGSANQVSSHYWKNLRQ